MGRPAAVVVAWALGAALAGGARAESTARVEAVAGYDSNLTRAEGERRGGGPLSRVVLDLGDSVRPAGGWLLSGRYHGGARRQLGQAAIPCRDGAMDPTGEDALFHHLEGGLAGRLAGRLTLGARLDVRDRTTRAACHPRDFTHARISAPLGWSSGDWSARLAGVGERFHYKPDARFDAVSAGGQLTGQWSPGRWALSVSGEWLDRRYRGRADDAPADQVVRVSGGVRYGGEALLSARYGFSVNDSTRETGGYALHVVDLTGTVPLPARLLLSGRVSLVRILYDRPQLIGGSAVVDEQLLQDEGRSAVTLRLERPLTARWSVVAHGGWWGSPFETGPTYGRWLALGGIGYGGP